MPRPLTAHTRPLHQGRTVRQAALLRRRRHRACPSATGVSRAGRRESFPTLKQVNLHTVLNKNNFAHGSEQEYKQGRASQVFGVDKGNLALLVVHLQGLRFGASHGRLSHATGLITS